MTAIHAELVADGGQVFLIAVGPDVEVARAAKYLELLTPKFTRSSPPGALTVPLSWGAIVQLTAAMSQLGAAWTPGPRLAEWIREQQTARLTAGTSPLSYVVPAGLTPYPWQVSGADMIAKLGSVLITDEPRTGKTPTTVLGLVERAERGLPAFPAVVVAPASVVDPWIDNFNTWAPHLRAIAWRGSPKQRQALAGTADVYVASYETARVDSSADRHRPNPLTKLRPVSVVADECHLIKNPQAERSKSFRRLAGAASRNGGAIVALSGTPITHSPADLWPTLVALEPQAWPARERWVHRYCQTLQSDYKEEVLGLEQAREPEFRLTLLGQHRRVVRADVMAHLPAKTYSVRTVDVPPKWRKAYDDMEKQMLAELPTGEEISVMSVLAQLTRLSQLASAAADVKTTFETDADGVEQVKVNVTLMAPSWKVDALLEVLAERCTTNREPVAEQVLAFAPSRQLMQLAGQAAKEAGYRVGYVMGGQPAGERTATVKAFQAGELDLICATTGAGGTGLTLWNAGTVVFLQRPWSLVESIQAEDRAEGNPEAERGTEVIDIVARDTIDTRVREVLTERAGQLAELVQDPRIVTQLLGGKGAKASTPRAARLTQTAPGEVNGTDGPEGRPTTAPPSSREAVPASPGATPNPSTSKELSHV